MKEQESFFSKPIYKSSLIKVQDLVMVLVIMFLLIPLMIIKGGKELTVFHLTLITCFIVLFMMMGDYILRKKTLPEIENYNFSTENDDKIPIIKYIVSAVLVLGVLLAIMSYGVPGVLILCVFAIVLKIALALSIRLLVVYLKVFRPSFYNQYKTQAIDFKFKYSIHNLTGLTSFMLPLLVAFILGDPESLLSIDSFWILNSETLTKLGIVFLLMGLGYLITKRLELKSIKRHDNWSDFLNDYSKKSGLIGFAFALAMLIVFLSSGFCGSG